MPEWGRICRSVNVNLLHSSSRSILKATAAPLAFLFCVCKGLTDPRRLNPAASDAHPADVVYFTSLASPHEAVLRSPRLNELRSLVGWRMGPYVAAAFSQTIHSSDYKNNKSQSNLALRPHKMSTSSVVILWGWTVTTTMSTSTTFKALTPLSSELRVKPKYYRKSMFATFKIIATIRADFMDEMRGY